MHKRMPKLLCTGRKFGSTAGLNLARLCAVPFASRIARSYLADDRNCHLGLQIARRLVGS